MGLGPVIGTLVGNFAVRNIFGKPVFMTFAVPAGLGLIIIVLGFRYLDPELPLYVALRHPRPNTNEVVVEEEVFHAVREVEAQDGVGVGEGEEDGHVGGQFDEDHSEYTVLKQ
jgi:hypothetical protein